MTLRVYSLMLDDLPLVSLIIPLEEMFCFQRGLFMAYIEYPKAAK